MRKPLKKVISLPVVIEMLPLGLSDWIYREISKLESKKYPGALQRSDVLKWLEALCTTLGRLASMSCKSNGEQKSESVQPKISLPERVSDWLDMCKQRQDYSVSGYVEDSLVASIERLFFASNDQSTAIHVDFGPFSKEVKRILDALDQFSGYVGKLKEQEEAEKLKEQEKDAVNFGQYIDTNPGRNDSRSRSVDSTSTVDENSRPPTPEEVTKSSSLDSLKSRLEELLTSLKENKCDAHERFLVRVHELVQQIGSNDSMTEELTVRTGDEAVNEERSELVYSRLDHQLQQGSVCFVENQVRELNCIYDSVHAAVVFLSCRFSEQQAQTQSYFFAIFSQKKTSVLEQYMKFLSSNERYSSIMSFDNVPNNSSESVRAAVLTSIKENLNEITKDCKKDMLIDDKTLERIRAEYYRIVCLCLILTAHYVKQDRINVTGPHIEKQGGSVCSLFPASGLSMLIDNIVTEANEKNAEPTRKMYNSPDQFKGVKDYAVSGLLHNADRFLDGYLDRLEKLSGVKENNSSMLQI